MYQPKRIQAGARAPDSRSPKANRKNNKIKQIKSKIFKNLNEFPIELPHEAKENRPINQALRTTSALAPEPRLPHRTDSALTHYERQPNKKRLSLDSTGKRLERDSVVSRTSLTKKTTKNNPRINEEAKVRMAEQRRKSNVSCASAIEQTQGRPSKKQSVKGKRPSVSNLQLSSKVRGKQNRSPKNKVEERSRSKSIQQRRKSTAPLDKSKTSSTLHPQKIFLKKKQSTSSAFLAPRRKKKTGNKKKSPRQDPNDQFSLQQYPISKYEVGYGTNHSQNPRIAVGKSRSRSKKGSMSKAGRSMLVDYASCINIPSNSSGLINSLDSRDSGASSGQIKIMDNWEFRYLGEETASLDLEQIRYFESFQGSKGRQERDFMDKKFKRGQKYRCRRAIEEQITEQYPHFRELELKFLASVIFIQRQWRQHKLYRQVFRTFGSPEKLSQHSFQQSNSKQLHISLCPRSSEKVTRIKTEQKEEQSYSPPKELQSVRKKSEPSLKQSVLNKIYSQFQQIDSEEQIVSQPSHRIEEERRIEQQRYNRMQEETNPREIHQQEKIDESGCLSFRSRNYDFLSKQLFPSMSYFLLKQEQLKQELYHKINQLSDLQRIGTIDGREFQKLRAQMELQYHKEVSSLNNSRKDLKKGYLSFIQTYKHIKQEKGLRRVSSESGPMALLYRKVFNLDWTNKNSSDSSESMKKLTKQVLIRREFYQSQKIEPNILNASIQNSKSARQQTAHSQEPSSFSARFSRRPQIETTELYQVEQQQNLCINRIREGLIVSPEVYEISPARSPLPISSFQSLERQERQVLEEVLAVLTHQLFAQLVKIDERRQNAIDIVLDGLDPQPYMLRPSDIRDFEIVEESSSVDLDKPDRDRDEDFEIVQEFKFRQTFRIEGLAQRPEQNLNRKHRNSDVFNPSPVSVEVMPFQVEQIMSYGQQLFEFVQTMHLQTDILEKLNRNQGFTPQEYLKFLRDFEIPDEEYDPLISNEIFIEWEDSFYRGRQLPQDDEPYSRRQAVTIFHRCIFECLIGLLQDRRPSGDKGEPFPWQKTLFFKRPLLLSGAGSLFEGCLSQLCLLIQLRCGIIQQKQLILSEDDMQRLHEQNQDKIINMLQKQLSLSPDSWYEVEQHGLQIKLEIEIQIYEYLMLQALDELLELG